ncbi:condensation domain-containing protein [Streptomyces sp. NBS 14/10]|uniref:condensation domain-containing protein n=1 Tax=Streptomyces sp. NBS 14/10 TaxID=1945643 RepID=UPI000B7D3669|nr:condensation domain-containing protein [Streptomyces sp. NBS 14/10]KAK1176841.1 condensation domain-containing protein [Streptomyces sp. NBS 14/10]
MRQTARHDVVFIAGTAGEHELTWSQKAHDREECQPHLDGTRNRNVRMARALDGRPDMAAVLHAFAAVVARCEALRTLYPRDADGRPRAVIVASGVLQVDEYGFEAPANKGEVEALAHRLAQLGFASDDLPLRAAVVTVDGRPTQIVLSLHHFSADTTAARIVAEHIARLAADPGADLGSGWQPRQIASFEASPSGLRHAHRVDTHDRAMLRQSAMPELQEPASLDGDAVYNFVRLDSAAVALAATSLAKQYRTSVAAVLQAAYACTLAEHLSIGACVFNTVTANRRRAAAREAVAHIAGRVLVPVDTSLGGDRFPALCRALDATLARSASVSLREPERYARALDEASAELGRSALNPYMVNIRPIAPRTLIRARSNRAQDIERAMASSRYQRLPGPVEAYSGKLTFDVWSLSETAGISLGTDAASFDAADLEQILLRFERRLVGAAIGGHAGRSRAFADG